MKEHKLVLSLIGVFAFGIAALADDAPSGRPVVSHGKLLADCIVELRADTPGASEKKLKQDCERKLKAYHNRPSDIDTPAKTPSN